MTPVTVTNQTIKEEEGEDGKTESIQSHMKTFSMMVKEDVTEFKKNDDNLASAMTQKYDAMD